MSDFQNFLDRFSLSKEKFAEAAIKWEELVQIRSAYTGAKDGLLRLANHVSAELQTCRAVHSVRSRVKDSDHLVEKIIRKRVQKKDKYLTISVDNFMESVTDLVGVRAMHLFKQEWEQVHEFIQEKWEVVESIAYIRKGDAEDESYGKKHFKVENHPAGYRSIHYVIREHMGKRQVVVEIQVRTIFEEGWSEIDHRVRYPYFIDDPVISGLLAIFNRLAGSADEMGTFTQSLASHLNQHREEIAKLQKRLEAQVDSLSKSKPDVDLSAMRRDLDLIVEMSGSGPLKYLDVPWIPLVQRKDEFLPFLTIPSQELELFRAAAVAAEDQRPKIGGFSPAEVRRVMEWAKEQGLDTNAEAMRHTEEGPGQADRIGPVQSAEKAPDSKRKKRSKPKT